MLSWDFTSITEKYLCYQVKFLLRKLCKCPESVSEDEGGEARVPGLGGV